jgi:hypothetical protein
MPLYIYCTFNWVVITSVSHVSMFLLMPSAPKQVFGRVQHPATASVT